MGRAFQWLSERTPVELAGLAAAIGVFGYLGWDSALWDARFQLLLHLIAIGAIVGLCVAAFRGAAMPRTSIDVPILALVAALALATVSALNVGMSLRAMGSIVAFAMALPIALLAVRHRPTWVGVVASVPVLLLAVPTLAAIGWRRIEWILVGAPGLPPLRMANEGTPFGSAAVPPFVIWPAWALAGLIEDAGWRRGIRTGLVAVGIPLTILSGSRSAWLAIAVIAVVAGVPWMWARRRRLGTILSLRGRALLIAVGGAAAGLLVLALLIPRLLVLGSILDRITLWQDTLRIGPGFMPYARQAAAPDLRFPVHQPHSHNVPLGVLGDAGLLGLAVAVVLVLTLAMVAGPWRATTATGRAAALVLLGLAVGGLSEDLTFLPNFNLLAILLVAVALLDARGNRRAGHGSRCSPPVRHDRVRRRRAGAPARHRRRMEPRLVGVAGLARAGRGDRPLASGDPEIDGRRCRSGGRPRSRTQRRRGSPGTQLGRRQVLGEPGAGMRGRQRPGLPGGGTGTCGGDGQLRWRRDGERRVRR
jgi:O-antigen ligase